MVPNESIARMEKLAVWVEDKWKKSRVIAWFLVLAGFSAALWFYLCPHSPGWCIGVLAFAAGIMSLRPDMHIFEKAAWIIMLGAFVVLEFNAIGRNDADNLQARKEVNEKLGTIKDGIERSTSQLAVISWGIASIANTQAHQSAVATPKYPKEHQVSGKRSLSAEELGIELKRTERSSATVINDGTNEAGNFANQLVIGLRFGGWIAGGNNIKMGDPEFFPDSLTVEVSANPASPEDHSTAEAKVLIAALKKQGLVATLRFTTLAFPPNFMRIKVAGQ